jgi:hypothetical protein
MASKCPLRTELYQHKASGFAREATRSGAKSTRIGGRERLKVTICLLRRRLKESGVQRQLESSSSRSAITRNCAQNTRLFDQLPPDLGSRLCPLTGVLAAVEEARSGAAAREFFSASIDNRSWQDHID